MFVLQTFSFSVCSELSKNVILLKIVVVKALAFIKLQRLMKVEKIFTHAVIRPKKNSLVYDFSLILEEVGRSEKFFLFYFLAHLYISFFILLFSSPVRKYR